jgi:hypothetical protein
MRPVGAKIFHADGQAYRQTTLIVAFRNFVNASKNGTHQGQQKNTLYWGAAVTINTVQ